MRVGKERRRPSRRGLVAAAIAALVAVLVLLAAVARPGARAATAPTRPAAAARGSVPHFHHVWLIMLENHSLSQVLGNPSAPYLNGLARRFGYADRYYSLRHPSLPNYLAMISGSTQGCLDDTCAGGYPGKTIVDQLAHHRLRWRVFAEGLPHRGYVGGNAPGYIRHHDPFVYFSRITGSPKRRRSILPLSSLGKSLRRPPAFSFIVPDNAHDMHTGTIAAADAWLRKWVGRIRASSGYLQSGVIFIAFDEGEHSDTSGCCLPGVHGGRTLLVVVSRSGKRGYVSRRAHSAYSLTRTIEDIFGFRKHLGMAAPALPYTGFWSRRAPRTAAGTPHGAAR